MTCEAVCEMTRRGHSILAGITDVCSMIGNEDDVEESVTSENCAACICEANGKPEQV